MPHRCAAMLPSPSSLRSLLRLSRRLHSPNPRLPTPPHLRLLSSSSSSSSGAGWTSYDPFTDSLGPPTAIPSSASASASAADDDPEAAAAGEDAWGVFDPVTGRIVMREQPPYSPPPEANSDEDASKVRKSVREETARWSSVAAVRKPGGKAGKERVTYVCSNCGEGSSQWWGVCRYCEATGTITKYYPGAAGNGSPASDHAYRSWIPQKSKEMVPQSLQEVTKGVTRSDWRIPLSGTFGMEIARVLGGGIVPGSLILVGGDPGVGKSSLILQLASIVSETTGAGESSAVIYVSGEESIEQIGNRAQRMSIKSRNLYLYSSTDIEDILDKIQPLSPRALIIDSIQTVYLRSFAGSAGNMTQVKECTSALLRFAKLTNIPVFLIGHVTKSGDIAGPRLLEHIVDVVLYMELGVFEMSGYGLQPVLNPTEMFLTEHDSDSEILAGLAVAVVLDGSRTFAIEVQALCVSGPHRNGEVVGIPRNRADVIISVLMKQAGLKLQDNAVFLNVVSGFMLTETAGDLAIAASICSSFLEYPIPNDIAFIGEVGLGGELRTVPRMDKRVLAIAKLGYKKCVVPKTSYKLLKPLNLDLEILPCNNLKEVINTIFRPQG
uniref:RecA family profile 1 domain-containing protein n=1 Tax=Leersia perrieri TaxID=77586 RepID=A0A0D9WM01_9ORYZ